MCIRVRREYEVESLDAERAARFAAAALLNHLQPVDWQISSDVELVVAQYMGALRGQVDRGTAVVEVIVHGTYVEVVISADDPRWLDERVRLRPRHPFSSAIACELADPRPAPLPRPVLWPALARTQAEATPQEWSATWEALHEVTDSIRLGGGDLTTTLDAVAAGVVKATTFTVAAVNLVMDSGDFQVVTVAGSDGARAALLGVVEPAERWAELIDGGAAWGSLRFVPHDSPLPSNTVMTTWVESEQEPEDPDIWNPLDALIAPLYSLEHVCLGALSVDLPVGAPRPDAADLARLEVFADHAASAIERGRLE